MRSLVACLVLFILEVQGNYFKEIEKMLISEQAKVATGKLAEDLAGGADSPKEISIFCPSVCFMPRNFIFL
jgi:hypothetical protein